MFDFFSSKKADLIYDRGKAKTAKKAVADAYSQLSTYKKDISNILTDINQSWKDDNGSTMQDIIDEITLQLDDMMTNASSIEIAISTVIQNLDSAIAEEEKILEGKPKYYI